MFHHLSSWHGFAFVCLSLFNTACPVSGLAVQGSSFTSNSSVIPTLNIDDFTVSRKWNSTLLPSYVCYLTSFFALQDLALEDFTSTGYATNTWQVPAYLQLAVSVSPPSDQSRTDVRYAIWGIASSINIMLDGIRYETANFQSFYQARPVGFVNFTDPELVAAPINKPEVEASSVPFDTTENEISVSPLEEFNNSAPITYALAPPTSNSTNNTMWGTANLTIQVSFTTIEIDQASYLTALVDAIVALAPQPANATVARWTIRTPGSGTQLDLTFAREPARVLTIGHIVRALGAWRLASHFAPEGDMERSRCRCFRQWVDCRSWDGAEMG